ncbi:2-amino-4-hydroxy-6-hydroxymethyldihydropteridine diphosphokinase [Marinobacter zhejiangensis]|uniref:2-amino-4-hydroxy-6-hydroxymethyldihydropteridine pyrophosphokinase n=1 Tax=Marinobacter zhejiangensis TaxID=488535 RepID=A0A1I4MI32_9GAMM|nr:2-amino-4-hydroxy-6-hydroxymethyldihydropteridine diphosphokinase [Marinobacter zhejiangensis]SFM02874.1 2-amino-4-hydroxy-6-hydroxymethyldihydropteridinediphosphokinase [Marinobacter zhejiangensis]
MAVTAYIGLGSNLAEPLKQLASAVVALAMLPETTLVAQSPFYRSSPVGPQDQPDFINGAVQLTTALPPLALLDALQAIEQDQGRERLQHWGPRTLDLDLLLYGHDMIDHERLQVPHPELPNRDFALQPLLDLAPDLTLPDGRALSELRRQCPDNHLQRLEPVGSDTPSWP